MRFLQLGDDPEALVVERGITRRRDLPLDVGSLRDEVDSEMGIRTHRAENPIRTRDDARPAAVVADHAHGLRIPEPGKVQHPRGIRAAESKNSLPRVANHHVAAMILCEERRDFPLDEVLILTLVLQHVIEAVRPPPPDLVVVMKRAPGAEQHVVVREEPPILPDLLSLDVGPGKQHRIALRTR